jgi:hypothetical protein
VAKKKEEVFNIVDGQNVIVLEVDTGLGFQTSGGPYLPGLDDNFLSARDVYLPIVCYLPILSAMPGLYFCELHTDIFTYRLTL